MTSRILDRIVHDQWAYFDAYEDGCLHYRLYNRVANEIYRLIVPLDEAKGRWTAEVKATTLRLHIQRAAKAGRFIPLIP